MRPDGTPKGYKPSELGEIPEDWEVCEMGSLGFTYGGLTGKSKKDFGHGNGLYVPFTNVMANIIVDIAKLEKVHVAENQNDVINGDLLFNGSSETPEEVCFCSLVNNDVSGLYLNSFCFGFRRKDGAQYIPIYLSYWFRSSIGRKAVSIMAQGSTRYNISKKQFLKLSITLPSIEEQTAIATILSDMDNELQALTRARSRTFFKQGTRI
ncbi:MULTISPECIES: restriction endonuclease subunit S [unclassified Aeromonas]|uniref:restriction endonuclease subunit S n=1 Tax=unclassified Aeromonas TaxID=257493 RepID=UPI002FDA1AF3